MSKKIGHVGQGRMGFPMAVNLKKAGFQVIGFDAYKGIYESALSWDHHGGHSARSCGARR